RVFAKQARAGRLRLPRLIASPLLVATLFIGAVINFAAFYTYIYEDFEVARTVRDAMLSLTAQSTVGAAAVGLLAFGFVMRRVVELSNSFVHVGRDLVDHQYDPDPKVLARRTQPLRRLARAAMRPTVRFRRRRRIQSRLEELVDAVIARQEIDRLIFVAHSQGTVITHDFLINHDDLKEVRPRTQELFKRVSAIDVLTVGSPLSHLYRYYFRDYDALADAPRGDRHLLARVTSWTNMWRVDDPIGGEVDLYSGIVNIGLPPGGHVDYWRAPGFCEVLWARINGISDSTSVGAAPVAETAPLSRPLTAETLVR
ncbi:MAG: hypothetical protein AAGG99_08360, partial [Pseudomonadota bacterium]